MASVAFNRGVRPPDGFAFILGLIIIAIKIALTVGFAWFVCLCGIIGFETVRLGTSITTGGILSIAPHYYVAALYMAVCLLGIILVVKQAFTIGLFGFAAYQQAEPEKEEKEEK